jgi:hypothetical protein
MRRRSFLSALAGAGVAIHLKPRPRQATGTVTVIEPVDPCAANGSSSPPDWQTFAHPPLESPGIVVDGLTNDVPFLFRVAPVDGPWSNIAGPYTPIGT